LLVGNSAIIHVSFTCHTAASDPIVYATDLE
jgi:hypothetical protein